MIGARTVSVLLAAAALVCASDASAATAPPSVHVKQGQLGYMTNLPIMDGSIAWASPDRVYLRELSSPVLQTVARITEPDEVSKVFAAAGRIAVEFGIDQKHIEVYDRDANGWHATQVFKYEESPAPPSCGRRADLAGVGSQGQVIVQYAEYFGIGKRCEVQRLHDVVEAHYPDGTKRVLYEKWSGWSLRGVAQSEVIGANNDWLVIERAGEQGTFLRDGATGNEFPLVLGGGYPLVDPSGRVIDNDWIERIQTLYPVPGTGPPVRMKRRGYTTTYEFCGDQILEIARRARPPETRRAKWPESGPFRLRLMNLSGGFLRALPEKFAASADFSGCNADLAVFTTYLKGRNGGTQVHVALR